MDAMSAMPPIVKATGRLDVQVWTGWQAIEPLMADWKSLETRAAKGTAFFQSVQWCEAWCAMARQRLAGPADQAVFVGIFKDGFLAALWPFQISTILGGLRVLTFLGGRTAEYGDPLIDTDQLNVEDLGICGQKVLAQIDCDLVLLDNIPVGSPFLAALTQAGVREAPARYTSELELTTFRDSRDYQSQYSRATRRSLRRKRDKLAEIGALTTEVAWGGSPAYAHIVEQAFAMKRQWLDETGRRKSFFADASIEALFATFPSDPDRKIGAVAIALLAGDRTVSCEVGFCFQGRYLSYIGAFDWTLRSRSPGRLELEAAIAWAIDNRFSSFDLLGNPTEAKTQVCNQFTPLVCYREPRSIRGHLMGALTSPRVTNTVKKVYYSLPAPLRRFMP